jgi:hypothetical protein
MRALSRIFVAIAAAVALMTGCTLTHRPTATFNAQPQSQAAPPPDGLLLWLEPDPPQGGFNLQRDAEGKVGRWNDHRGDGRAVVALPGFAQAPRVIRLTVPATPAVSDVTVLSCRARGEQACAYAYSGPGEGDLAGNPYMIFGVVQRASDRGDNYFVMTTGSGCSALFGGTGCTNNTALHLGWSGGTTLRLGQYGNDAVLDGTPAFDPANIVTSLIDGLFLLNGEPDRRVELLDPVVMEAFTGGDATPLSNFGHLMVGGTGYTDQFGPGVPNWYFDGEIIALLVYTRALSLAEVQTAQDYLRTRFGPR